MRDSDGKLIFNKRKRGRVERIYHIMKERNKNAS